MTTGYLLFLKINVMRYFLHTIIPLIHIIALVLTPVARLYCFRNFSLSFLPQLCVFEERTAATKDNKQNYTAKITPSYLKHRFVSVFGSPAHANWFVNTSSSLKSLMRSLRANKDTCLLPCQQ